MAKILFISINDENARGFRILSSCLREKGHESFIVFLEKYLQPALTKEINKDDWVGIDINGNFFRHVRGPEASDKEKVILINLINRLKPDIIGFSVTTPLKKRIINITRLIKGNFQMPVVWGGPEASMNPEGCAWHCDYVCIGEGENSILEIAARIDMHKDINSVFNLAYIRDGKFIENNLYPLVRELDKLPFKDMDQRNKFFIGEDSLLDNFEQLSYDLNFHVMTSRGCPHRCTYCCESCYQRIYPNEKFLRRRSPRNVIEEIKKAKDLVSYKYVHFEDEVFTIDYQWLQDFSGLYKKEIGIPFCCYIYANSNINKTLELLKDTGLGRVVLSLQSGSQRINRDVFRRPFSKSNFLKTAEFLQVLNISYLVDVITYNPFEREEDLKATLEILVEAPKPFDICVNKLYITKGTEIYDLLKKSRCAGTLKVLPDRIFNYYARLFWLTINNNVSLRMLLLIRRLRIFKIFPFLLNPNLMHRLSCILRKLHLLKLC